MKKSILCLMAFLSITTILQAKKGKDSLDIARRAQLHFVDSVESALHWQMNTVSIASGIVNLNLNNNFKFLNSEQSNYVLHDLWGNPPRPDVLGMIFPASSGPFDDSSYAFVITYDADGYVKDNDADKINYDDMFKDIKAQETQDNKTREKDGYQPIYMMGWAAQPYYDKQNKVLHWARELQFGSDSVHTLNYDVRVLGRKGILSLNAIASMSELALVKANINEVLKIPEFTPGNKYTDFNSSTDKVAEYGIGALVAGGILAKTGFFAVIGKFLLAAWKFIMIGLAALWGAIKKFFGSRKKKDDYQESIAKYEP
jgi:uncharacterized membrane-anchored protein